MASSMSLVNGHPCPAHLGPNGYGYATPSLLSLKNLLLCSNTPVDDYRRPCAVTPEEEFLLPMLMMMIMMMMNTGTPFKTQSQSAIVVAITIMSFQMFATEPGTASTSCEGRLLCCSCCWRKIDGACILYNLWTAEQRRPY
mgnify:CR=1 FL=1